MEKSGAGRGAPVNDNFMMATLSKMQMRTTNDMNQAAGKSQFTE